MARIVAPLHAQEHFALLISILEPYGQATEIILFQDSTDWIVDIIYVWADHDWASVVGSVRALVKVPNELCGE